MTEHQPQPERVHVLVDFSHIWMCVKDIIGVEAFERRGVRMNFRRMHEGIINSNGQQRMMGEHSTIFRSEPPKPDKSFLSQEDRDLLRQLGYKERLFPLRKKLVTCFGCKRWWHSHSEKTVDAAIISAMYDIAISMFEGKTSGRIALVSGDGDFAEAITNIRNRLGIVVEVWAFRGHTSHAYLEQRLIAGTLDALGVIER